MMRITETVKQLIIINIIFFVGTMIVGRVANDYLALHMPTDNKFQIWQIFTHMFMHADIGHIFFNMFGLFMFGSALEQMWGSKKFIFFYISCGLGSAALHLGVNYFELQHILQDAANLNLSSDVVRQVLNATIDDGSRYRPDLFEQDIIPILRDKYAILDSVNAQALFDAAVFNQRPMLGASGAVYGILVAFAFMFPNSELMLLFLPIPIKAKYFVPGILVIDLVLGIRGNSIFGGAGDGVAHFAHLGGALIGFIMMWYWKKNQFNNNRWN